MALERGAWDLVADPREVLEAVPLRCEDNVVDILRKKSDSIPVPATVRVSAHEQTGGMRAIQTLHSAFGVEMTATRGLCTPKMMRPAS